MTTESRPRLKITYATLRNDNEELHAQFDAGLGKARGSDQVSSSSATSGRWSDARRASVKAAADRAIALQPSLPEGHVSLGYYYYHGFLDYDHALALLFPFFQVATLAALFGWLRRRGVSWPVPLAAAALLSQLEPLYSADAGRETPGQRTRRVSGTRRARGRGAPDHCAPR